MPTKGPYIRFKTVNSPEIMGDAGVGKTLVSPLYAPTKFELTGTVEAYFTDEKLVAELDAGAVAMKERAKEMIRAYQEQALHSLLGTPNFPVTPHFVYCSYKLASGRSQLTQVFCPKDNKAALADILAKRGMGEVYDSPASGYYERPKMPSEHLLAGDVHKAMHAAIWVGMVLNHCDPEAGRVAMMDDGAIHELSHLVETHYSGYSGRSMRGVEKLSESNLRLAESLIALEARVPGLRPSWGLPAEDAAAFDRAQNEKIATVRRARAEETRRQNELYAQQSLAYYDRIMRGTGEMGRAFDGLKTMMQSTVITLDEMRSLYWPRDYIARPAKPKLPNHRTFEMSRLDDAKTAKQKRVEAFMAAREKKLASTPAKPGEITGTLTETSTSALVAAMAGGKVTIGVDLAGKKDAPMSVVVMGDMHAAPALSLDDVISRGLTSKGASFDDILASYADKPIMLPGSVSGRMSMSGPDMQRLPKADYSAIERRLLMHAVGSKANILAEAYGFIG